MSLKIKIMDKRPDDLNFLDHLDELRGRLIKSALAVVSAACLFYPVVDEALAILIKPMGKVIFTAPGEAFMTRITLTMIGGVFLALPVILFQGWRFVAAGLKEHEIKYVKIFAPFSFLLFWAGVLFSYYIVVPISIRFLLGFSSDVIVPMITIKNYVSFVATMLLAFGIIFELPLILMFLTMIGVASPAFLIQKRKYAVVMILIVSALITPPDVISQLLMAVPLIILYEIGIVVSRAVYRR